MKKILIVLVLIFSLFTTTEKAYSYFEENQTPTITNEDNLYVLNETLNTNEKSLIPTTSVLGVNDTHSIIFQYEIVVEKDITLTPDVLNLVLENSELQSQELNEIFNFYLRIDHKEDTVLREGLFTQSTEGEVVVLTVEITMNDTQYSEYFRTNLGDNLSFDCILTVSNT